MESRKVKFVFGDWADDGHGQTITYIANISGENISDADLNNHYYSMVEKIGFDIMDLANDYEDNSISSDQVKALTDNGFNIEDYSDDMGSLYCDDEEVSILRIFEFMLGCKIEIVCDDIPTIIGGYKTVLNDSKRHPVSTSFGYGLFW